MTPDSADDGVPERRVRGLTADETTDPWRSSATSCTSKTTVRRVVEGGSSMLVVGLIFVFVIPAVTDSHYSEIWHEIAKLSSMQLLGLTVLWVLGMLAYTRRAHQQPARADPPPGRSP